MCLYIEDRLPKYWAGLGKGEEMKRNKILWLFNFFYFYNCFVRPGVRLMFIVKSQLYFANTKRKRKRKSTISSSHLDQCALYICIVTQINLEVLGPYNKQYPSVRKKICVFIEKRNNLRNIEYYGMILTLSLDIVLVVQFNLNITMSKKPKN